MKKIWALLIIAVVLSVCLSACTDDQTPVDPANGSFETLDQVACPANIEFNGKHPTDPAATGFGVSAFVETAETYVNDGEKSVRVEASPNTENYITLTFSDLLPSTTYQITFQGMGDFDGTLSADAEFYGADGYISTRFAVAGEAVGVASDSWATHSTILTTPESCTSLKYTITVPGGNGTVYIDNVILASTDSASTDGAPALDISPENLFINSGFEDASALPENATFESDPANVYDGVNAIKVSAENTTYIPIETEELTAGSTYRAVFRVKGTTPSDAPVSLEILCTTPGDIPHNVGTAGYGVIPGDDGWSTFVYDFKIAPNMKDSRFVLKVPAGGEICADGFRLYKHADPGKGPRKMNVVQLTTEFVFYYYGEQEQSFANLTFLGAAKPEDHITHIRLLDGNTVLMEETAPVFDEDKNSVFTFDMSLLAEKGHGYTLSVVVYDTEGNTVQVSGETMYVYDRPTHLNKNGEFIDENGEVFHPIFCMWSPVWSEIDLLEEAGINTIQWSMPEDYDERIQQLDDLYERGMKAIVVCYWEMYPAGHPINVERVSEAIRTVKDHPAIYGYKVADEPFWTADPVGDINVRQMMINTYKMVRDIDPHHPITYVENVYTEYVESKNFADVIMIDPYPGFGGTFYDYVGDKTLQACVDTNYSRPVLDVLQAFVFGCYPSPVELHSMIYQSYLGGARAAGYFGVGGAGGGYLEHSTDLWPAIKSYAANEQDILLNHYSSGVEPNVVTVREDRTWYDIWEADGVYYLAVQNRNYKENDVVIDLPFDVAEVEVLSKIAEVPVSVTDGVMTINLEDSQAALIKLTPQ